jgi:hypothetical protein
MNSTAKPMASGPAAGVRRSISIGFTMVATALVTTVVLQWRSHYLAEGRLDLLQARTASVLLRLERSFDEAWNRAEHRIRQWDRAANAALEDSSAESLRRRHLTAHQSAAERSMSAMLTAANRAEGELANLWEEAVVAGLDADELDFLQETQSEWVDRARALQDRFEAVEFVAADVADRLDELTRRELETDQARREADSRALAQAEALARVQADAMVARAQAESVQRQLESLQMVQAVASARLIAGNSHDETPIPRWRSDTRRVEVSDRVAEPLWQPNPGVCDPTPRHIAYARNPFGYRVSPRYHPSRHGFRTYGHPHFETGLARPLRVARPGWARPTAGYACVR